MILDGSNTSKANVSYSPDEFRFNVGPARKFTSGTGGTHESESESESFRRVVANFDSKRTKVGLFRAVTLFAEKNPGVLHGRY